MRHQPRKYSRTLNHPYIFPVSLSIRTYIMIVQYETHAEATTHQYLFRGDQVGLKLSSPLHCLFDTFFRVFGFPGKKVNIGPRNSLTDL